MRRSQPNLHPALPLILLIAAFGTQVQAATYMVGTGGGCTHSTIQAALDSAAAASGPNIVRITRSATWTAQALTAVTNSSLTIEGGFATCTQTVSDGIKTTISGSGGSSASVLAISVPTLNASMTVRNLTIRDGDASAENFGGGIRLSGTGTLTIVGTAIQNNVAGLGGGIHAEGSPAAPARLVLGGGVFVLNNTAREDGGGIHLDKAELSMNEPDSLLFGNVAEGQNNTGYGGGLLIRGSSTPAIASIGGGGANGLASIHGNLARFGGGVAVLGANPQAGGGSAISELRLYTRSTLPPGAIRSNAASVAGGAIYVRSHEGTPGTGNVQSSARLWRVVLEGNTAPDGAAVFIERQAQPAGNGIGGRLEIDFGVPPLPGISCSSDDFCTRISGNRTESPSGQYQAGSTIWANLGTVAIGSAPAGSAPGGGSLFSANVAGGLIEGLGCLVTLANAQITANTIGRLVIGGSCDNVELSDLTIAGNTITQASVLSFQAPVTLRRSIIWQPGKTTLVGSGTRSISDIVTSERASLDAAGAQFVEQADPRFIDPAHGDFGLRAASPAVDRAPTVAGDDRDALGQARDIDLPVNGNAPRGPRDVGALERQALAPLVLNADFDFSDLRLWTRVTGEWDGSQSVSGGAGSGSWKYSASGLNVQRVVLGQHCVHLPGPGRYRLNGRGHGGGNTIPSRDFAVLEWEFRRDGTETCNFGMPSDFGELTVGSGLNWGQAANPAVIDVAAADWSATSSLTITLVAVDGGITSPRSISAWFDGITLEAVSWDDILFANGFDAP